jgi:predicted CoA-binding protein
LRFRRFWGIIHFVAEQTGSPQGRRSDGTVLDVFFNPQAVAVIGASQTPGKLGHSVLHNVIHHGYGDAVYPINTAALPIGH